MAHKKGNPKTENSGRKLGTPNKFTGTVKDAVLETFQALGGVQDMTDWAKDNRTDFYRIIAKLLPKTVDANISGSMDLKQLTDEECLERVKEIQARLKYYPLGAQ